jgi:hypothetical protein
MKRIDNRQNKTHQWGLRRVRDRSVQIKINKRGGNLIDRRGPKK